MTRQARRHQRFTPTGPPPPEQVEPHLLATLDAAWARGWLPGEIVREVDRRLGPLARGIAELAVTVDHTHRPAATVPRRWAAHVLALGLPLPSDAGPGWLRRHHLRLGAEPERCAAEALVVIRHVGALGPIGTVLPPPGSGGAAAGGAGRAAAGPLLDLDRDPALDPILTKVRALLAQAESTNFEAEATTFTAKAQELMARHAIDAALLWGRTGSRDNPTMVRLPVDEPYLRAKTTLLHVVAARSSCRSVYYPAYALVALIGFDQDLLAAETLYTSLLVQAQLAVQAAGAAAPAGAHERSRGFRSSFLHAYAHRVGQRLAEVNEQVQAEATAAGGGADLLPVLADRAERVEAWMAAELGPLRRQRASSSMDASGWAAGSRAANRADLGRAGSLGRSGPALDPGGR